MLVLNFPHREQEKRGYSPAPFDARETQGGPPLFDRRKSATGGDIQTIQAKPWLDHPPNAQGVPADEEHVHDQGDDIMDRQTF